MAHTQKSSTSSRGTKSPTGRAPRSNARTSPSTAGAPGASSSRSRLQEDRREGGGPATWNRPTQGANASGPQSFDEDDSGPIYGSQSGSNLTKDTGVNENTKAKRAKNRDRSDEEKNFGKASSQAGRANSTQDFSSPRSSNENFGDQSYGSYAIGTSGSRSSASSRGGRQSPAGSPETERQDRKSDNNNPGFHNPEEGYNIHDENENEHDQDFRMKGRNSRNQDSENDFEDEDDTRFSSDDDDDDQEDFEPGNGRGRPSSNQR